MTVRDALSTCIFRKYANGAGRASRGEFFAFFAFYVLFCMLWNVCLMGIVRFLGGLGLPGLVLTFLPYLLLPPLLAVSVRRLYDSGRPGWFALLLFVPLLNLFCLVLLCLPGTPGPNRFGEAPAPVRFVWS